MGNSTAVCDPFHTFTTNFTLNILQRVMAARSSGWKSNIEEMNALNNSNTRLFYKIVPAVAIIQLILVVWAYRTVLYQQSSVPRHSVASEQSHSEDTVLLSQQHTQQVIYYWHLTDTLIVW